MRELEFLPPWYAQARRRKRLVVLQTWMTLMVVAGLGTWFGMSHRNVMAREAKLAAKTSELMQARSDSQRMDEQLQLKQELVTRGKINEQVGAPVEMTRLLATLENIMPKEMSLCELDVKTEEQLKTVTDAASAKASKNGTPLVDRKLRVRLLAVAPTDLDMVNFLTGLTNISCFEQVAPTFAQNRFGSGKAMREFQVTFSVDLNQWTSQ
jgi:hypothetical protein